MIKRLLKKVAETFSGKQPASKVASAPHAVEKHKPADAREQWKPGQKGTSPAAEPAPQQHTQKPHGERPHRDQDRGPRRDHRGPRPERGPRSEQGPRGERPHHHDRPRGERPPREHREHREQRGPNLNRDRQASGQIDHLQISAEPWDATSFAVAPVEGKTRFHDLELPEPLMHAIADLKFQFCTPIQAQSLPVTLAGRDLFGKAQTGTGKTAAFLIAAFTRMLRNPRESTARGTPRVLVLAPTRELCIQIHKDALALGKYCGFNTVAVFGGMDYDKQRAQLTENNVDIVVATPGRLIDFKNRRDINLGQVEILVIDEADRMLDMGFIPDVREIVYATPPKGKRQTLFYSATLTDDILRLSSSWTHEPASIEIAPENVAVDTVEQQVYIVTSEEKFALLYSILQQPDAKRIIVFANRRDEAERLCDALTRWKIESALLSGAVAQDKRVRVLEGFRTGKYRVLVATDVAGRGIHVDGVTHVINFNLPDDPEDYVHRIGRTGRAGASGQSYSFACEDDSFAIPGLEKFLGRPLSFLHPEEHQVKLPASLDGAPAPAGMTPRRMGGGGRPPFRRGGPRGAGPRRGPPRR